MTSFVFSSSALVTLTMLHLVNGAVLSPGKEEDQRMKKTWTFWQISDIHLDEFYSVHGNPEHWCHDHRNVSNGNNDNVGGGGDGTSDNLLGKFGSYECEANWDLVKSAFEFMTKEQPEPGKDFSSRFDKNKLAKIGATTLSTTTFSIATLSKKGLL